MPIDNVRRHMLLAGAASVLGAPAFAQGKPITIIVPYSPGGTADLSTRVIAQFAAPSVGSPMVVDNRTGGGGLIGWGLASRAAPDGNTLLTVELAYAIAAGLLPNMPFDPLKAFSQITTAVKVPVEVRLGYASGAEVSFNGKVVDTQPFTTGETARLKLGL